MFKNWHITTIKLIVYFILCELVMFGIVTLSYLTKVYYDLTGISVYLMR